MTRTLDTGTDELLAHIDGPLGIITINRPETRNAITDAILAGFAKVLPELALDPQVRVVVLTGAAKAFSSGGDVKGMYASYVDSAEGTPSLEDQVTWMRTRQNGSSLALHEFPKPVIAVMPGAAAGAGMSLALACDMRIAAERSKIVIAFTDLGTSGDFGGSWFLTHLIGTAKARELYYTGARLSSSEALELGIFNQVWPNDGFEDAALEWCRELASQPPIALRLMKENLNRAMVHDLASCLDAEATNMIRTMATEDHVEAAIAFVEKRPAVFRGV